MMVRGAMHDWLYKIIANFFPIFPIYSRLPPIHKYNSAGNLIWKTPVQVSIGTVVETTDITFDRNGNVIIVGYAMGNVGGSSAGQADVFFARLSNSITTTTQAAVYEDDTTAKNQNQIKQFNLDDQMIDSLLSQPILTAQMLKSVDDLFSFDYL